MSKNNLININHGENFVEIPHEEVIKAQEVLKKHAKNKDFFRLNQYKIEVGVQIRKNYAYLNQRRSYYSECIFSASNFTNTGFTGSIFSRCDFVNSILSRTVFDSCNFRQCKFLASENGNNLLEGTNFNNAVFVECTFEGQIFDACLASSAIFENVVFRDCEFWGMLWESAAFNNVSFDNCQLKGLNFEQCIFENMHMNNIRLLFPTIPFIINGIKYLLETNDNVYISSTKSGDGQITKEEYLELLPVLEKFYYGTKNHFPLSNIYVAQKKYQEAFDCIISGLKVAIQLRAFKSLRAYCLLLKTIPVLEPKHFIFAYDCIQREINYQFYSVTDFYILSRYLGEIRQLLINGKNGTIVGITIRTGIEANEYDKLGALLSILNSIIDNSIAETNNYIEIRHFSPYEVFCQITANPEQIFSIVGIIYSALLGIDTLYKKYKENSLKSIEKKQALAQIDLIKAQTEQVKMDTMLKKQEYEKKLKENDKKIKEVHQAINVNGVIIRSISHNIVTETLLDCDPLLQSFSSLDNIT